MVPADLPEWFVYYGSLGPVPESVRERWLNNAPPWRRPLVESAQLPSETAEATEPELEERGSKYVLEDLEVLKLINAGLLLRRPLLVMGQPGVGKSLLAWSLARQLGLGRPLVWPVNSKSKLEDALYRYEAIAHLRASQSAPMREALAPGSSIHEEQPALPEDSNIGQFITLGPLGTAMVPGPRPRVLLIDEIDKASFDLPNDLLHVLEERRFVIPELLRVRTKTVKVVTWDSRQGQRTSVPVVDGSVLSGHFPVVVFTSNGDREFPPAFLRRCVCVHVERPAPSVLAKIAKEHLGRDVSEAEVEAALNAFEGSVPATDQVLSTLFLQTAHQVPTGDSVVALKRPG